MISIQYQLTGVNRFKVAVLFLCLVNGRSQYLVEKYAPQHENYETPKYSFAYGISDPVSGDHKHQWEKRDGDSVQGEYGLVQPDGIMRLVQYTADDHKGFVAVVKNLKVQVPQYTEGQALYRVRRNGVFNKERNTRGQVKEEDNVGTKYIRARYAATSHDNYNVKNRPNNPLPNVSDYLINADRDERSSKKIVKKENIPEAQFSFSSAHNSFEFVPNFNLNPLNTNVFKFQNDDEFIRHLSSIQPQHIHQQNYHDYSAVKLAQPQIKIVPQVVPQLQYYQRILPAKQPTVPIESSYQSGPVTNQPKWIINVPDEEVDNGEGDARLNHALSLIHSQPHIKSRLENLHKNPNFSPVTSTPSPTYVAPKIKDSGVVVINGHPKYTNYGYRYSEDPDPTYVPIFQSNKYQTPQNNTNHFQIPNNQQNIPQQSSSRGIYNTNFQPNTQPKKQNYIPENTLSMQHNFPVILLDSKAKIGLPFYPTSRNVYSVPYDVTFQYEGIPTGEKREQIFGVKVPVSSVPADRRLYTGLTFHASSRNLYDGKTPSLRNPPLQKGDTIWQAGDETTGDEPELLVRQLNETCAYIQWNETTPGNEDGTRYNIWNVGDYSAQLETETLIRSLNITCDNYTLDALNNFTSGYTIIDYCSQCLRNDSTDSDSDPEIDQRYAYNQETDNQEFIQNQQESYQPQNTQHDPGYDYSNQQIYNNFYQQGPTDYEFYVDNNNNGYNQFYKRKRYAENSKSL